MTLFVLRRLMMVVPLLAFVGLIVFSLVLLVPGDPAVAVAGERATVEDIELVREELGLNDPILIQYARWMGDAMRGDLGTSLFSSELVTSILWRRLPVTIALASAAMVLALLVAVPLGVVAAYHKGKLADRIATLIATLGVAVPNYWLGLMLLIGFAIWNPWFPSQGYHPLSEGLLQWVAYVALPAITLAARPTAEISRHLRGALSDVLDAEYIRTARAKGLGEYRVILKHAGKNALAPIATVVGLQYIHLLGGTVVIETVFDINGLGQLVLNAVLLRDVPVIQGVLLVSVLVAAFVNIIVDLSYGYANPQVRARQRGLVS